MKLVWPEHFTCKHEWVGSSIDFILLWLGICAVVMFVIPPKRFLLGPIKKNMANIHQKYEIEHGILKMKLPVSTEMTCICFSGK